MLVFVGRFIGGGLVFLFFYSTVLLFRIFVVVFCLFVVFLLAFVFVVLFCFWFNVGGDGDGGLTIFPSLFWFLV